MLFNELTPISPADFVRDYLGQNISNVLIDTAANTVILILKTGGRVAITSKSPLELTKRPL